MNIPLPLRIPLYYDFASSLCFVTDRVLARMADELAELDIEFVWKPIDLTQLTGWRRGASVPPDRAVNVARVSRELDVPLNMPPIWLDSREAASIAIALESGPREIAWRERVWTSIYEEGHFDALASAYSSLLPSMGWKIAEGTFTAASKKLDALTREAHDQMVTGVPTFMLDTWPFGGIQNEHAMRSILTRYAQKQRSKARETMN